MRRSRAEGSGSTRELGGWQLGKRLGKGGNGEVFTAEKHGSIAALKQLSERRLTPARIARFKDEVQAMRDCADIPGVLPLLDADLQPVDGAHPWFVMGLARPISDELGDAPPLRLVVQAIAAIASVLVAMHARGVSHRDIKPENLFFHEGQWAVGDFGLASFEGKTAETARGERIGPVYYIAPEMLNTATQADGRSADVFSLAKTLWVLATGQRFPLPGTYDPLHATFRLGSYIAEERTGPLDKLIASATAFNPAARPPMFQVAAELAAWLRPEPSAESQVSLDTGRFAAELDRRRLAMEAERELQQRTADVAGQSGLRVRESLRPFAREIEAALISAHFDSVVLNIDNYNWGFEVHGAIPGEQVRLKLTVDIHTGSTPSVEVSCRIALDAFRSTDRKLLIWEKSIGFLEGGSEEALRLAQLREGTRHALQRAVDRSLTKYLDGNKRNDVQNNFEIWVRSDSGRAIRGADVYLVGADGVFDRVATDTYGTARFVRVQLDEPTALIRQPLVL